MHRIQAVICANEWAHAYSRQDAAFRCFYVTQNKFWPSVARVNNTHGDRNLICSCEPVRCLRRSLNGDMLK